MSGELCGAVAGRRGEESRSVFVELDGASETRFFFALVDDDAELDGRDEPNVPMFGLGTAFTREVTDADEDTDGVDIDVVDTRDVELAR